MVTQDLPWKSRALSGFLLVGILTAAWVGLNFAFPNLGPTGIPIGVTFAITNVIILLGLWLGLARTDFTANTRATVWLAITIPFAVWISVVWWLAVQGAFLPARSVVPRLPVAILVPIPVGILLLTRSKRVASLLNATPPSWLIGLQLYRVLGGIFLVNWMQDTLPGAFALPAGIGDVLVGLLALPVAQFVSAGKPGSRKLGIWWNLLGLADLVLAITMGMLTSPGRFQVFALSHPNAQIGTFPTVMIPAFAVPYSIILHALSLWQLRRVERTGSIQTS
jgi:hypothetical protein